MGTTNHMIDIQNVDQVFRSGFWLKRVQILHGVSFQVAERSVFGFLGANGAGKTTLIHLLVGLREATRVLVLIGGVDANRPEARAQLGYLPERPYYYPHLTGEDFLKYYGTLSGLRNPQILARIPKVLSAVDLKEARRVELGRYSKGMLQRIGLAQAILHEPELLILDEPMSGLDPVGRREVREIIQSFSRQGHTVFFSSHVIPDVEAICTQVGMIDKGRIKGCGPIGQFLAEGPLRTEVAFSGVPDRSVEAMSKEIKKPIEKIQDGHCAVVSGQDEVQVLLRRIVEQKGAVLWVTPQRPSLESLFSEGRS